ncbi:hypothetical protein [Pseudonocardia sp. HH130630-07]|uniref:hypothetical protein n=1 Tax=Pseudonocardia sp. HH130630-07 TaxID=1690815 RepID=UPI0012EA832C|nr:hypothetical protein [Pseudonocardia sp. HH130630-07]
MSTDNPTEAEREAAEYAAWLVKLNITPEEQANFDAARARRAENAKTFGRTSHRH